VYRFLTHLADRRDAEDLTQETYLRAVQALPRFAGRSTAQTWLLSIDGRVAADHVRTTVRHPRLVAVPDWQATADTTRTGQRAGAVDDAVTLTRLVAELPAQRREAFVATQILGLSYAEAAEVCGCPVGTIRSRVARARDDLV
jgi:RNA polymerase sigma-70 factor (ECF subfamily)